MDIDHVIELMNQYTAATQVVSIIMVPRYRHEDTVLVTHRKGDRYKTDRWVRRWQKGVNIFRWEVLDG